MFSEQFTEYSSCCIFFDVKFPYQWKYIMIRWIFYCRAKRILSKKMNVKPKNCVNKMRTEVEYKQSGWICFILYGKRNVSAKHVYMSTLDLANGSFFYISGPALARTHTGQVRTSQSSNALGCVCVRAVHTKERHTFHKIDNGIHCVRLPEILPQVIKLNPRLSGITPSTATGEKPCSFGATKCPKIVRNKCT